MEITRISLFAFSICFLLLMCGCAPASTHQADPSSIFFDSAITTLWADDVSEMDSLAETDESIFYISKAGLMKYDKRNDQNTVLIEGETINSFRIYDNSLYYCNNEVTIYKADLNGENCIKVVELNQVEELLIEKNITRFEIYDGYVYIKSSGTSLIRFSLLEQKAEKFLDDAYEHAFFEEKIYYIDHAEKTFSVFCKDLATGQTDLLRGDGISKRNLPSEEHEQYLWYDNVIATNGHLFYTMRGPAKLIEVDSNGNDILIEGFNNIEEADYLTITANNNKLYYVLDSGLNVGKLFMYDIQKDEKKEIAKLDKRHDAFGIKVVGGYVFYYSLDDKALVHIPL